MATKVCNKPRRTRRDAGAVVRKIKSREGAESTINAYFCIYCHGWHVGNISQWQLKQDRHLPEKYRAEKEKTECK